MKTRHALLNGCMLLSLLTALPLTAQPSPDALLQSALYKQQIEGDLVGAAEIFRRLVVDYGQDRALAARALVHLGQVRETMEAADATEAYRRVLSDYPEQATAVSEARARLAVLAPATPSASADGPVARHVTTLQEVFYMPGLVSPDGRSVLYTDWQGIEGVIGAGTGALVARDVVSGTSRVLARGNPEIESYVIAGGMWSPDGKRVAYATWDHSWDNQSLHVVDADGTHDRVVSNNRQHVEILPGAWSSDGAFIATFIQGWDRAHRIGVVSVPDGEVTILKTLTGEADPSQLWDLQLSVSPDDRYVAYGWPVEGRKRDVFVLAVDGSGEETIASSAADEDQPYWTPDGEKLVFLSDRSGRRDLLAIDMREGKAVGEPELVRPGLGPVRLVGFNDNGALAYSQPFGETDVFVSDLDPFGAGVVRDRALTDRFVGTNRKPAWSLDGEKIAFLSTRTGTGLSPREFLVVRSVVDGSEAEFELNEVMAVHGDTRPAWSADGKSVYVVAGPPGDPSWGTQKGFEVDLDTGGIDVMPYVPDYGGWSPRNRRADGRQSAALRELGIRLTSSTDHLMFRSGNARLRPGEEALYVAFGIHRVRAWTCTPESTPPGTVCLDDPPQFAVETLVNSASREWELAPDGRSLVFVRTTVSDERRQSALVLWSLSGDPDPREVVAAEPGERILSPRWTPDGRSILYDVEVWEVVEGGGVRGVSSRVMRVDVADGTTQEIDVPEGFMLGDATFSPDGSTVAWTPRIKRGIEVWTLSGFPWDDESGR